MQYRRDIDGLRALAIVSVLFYHAGLGLSGGFIGVDIFFVISGYLITGIIIREMDANTFSLTKFYVRRSRRILPALFTMLLGSAVAAWVILLPNEMSRFADSFASVALFGSNIYFWRTGNYFAAPSDYLPLLHTWSLAVEEQFYIVFPLLLLTLGKSWRIFALGAAFILSLAVSVYGAVQSPVAAFYLLPTRAWELLSGTMIVLLGERVTRPKGEALPLLFLGMILAPVALYNSSTPFPGLAAVPPCLGAAGLIWLGEGHSVVTRLLRTRVAVGIGVLSYALYLWHWPILVFARISSIEPLTMSKSLGCLGLTAMLALGSFYLIERPVRSITVSPRRILVTAGSISLILAATGLSARGGFPERFPDFKKTTVNMGALFRSGRCTLIAEQTNWDAANCITGSGKTVFLWGDSFASHLAPGFRARPGIRLIQYTKAWCPPLVGRAPVQNASCDPFNAKGLALIEQYRPDVVILGGRWSSYDAERILDVASIEQTVKHIVGPKVILMGASPSFNFDDPRAYLYRAGNVPAAVSFDHTLNQRLQSGVSAAFFDPMLVLCPAYRCPLTVAAGDLYLDSGHLTALGSVKLVKAIPL